MIILVLNCGSSSVKYSLFSMGSEEIRLVRGSLERIGLPGARLIQETSDHKVECITSAADHSQAIAELMDILAKTYQSLLPSLDNIDAAGHRIVHGGDRFNDAVKIDDEILRYLWDQSYLAPLHNPPNLMGMKAISRLLPKIPQVAVFDTAFHQTLPPRAYLYALPYDLYKKHRIRRYGFHGTSHRYVAHEAARIMGKPLKDLKLLTCHLGNGSSIAAVKYGKSVDTTMGFTPLEGLAMGTRCGDVDPAVILFLQDRLGLSPSEIGDILNRQSGMVGLSGFSSDMREILKAVYLDGRGLDGALNTNHLRHERSKIALGVYIYRIRRYIGAYAAAMGGIDAILFTGGIGQNLSIIQNEACRGLEFMGVDMGSNMKSGMVSGIKSTAYLGQGCYQLSSLTSNVKVLAIPTDEELMIARDTLRTIQTL